MSKHDDDTCPHLVRASLLEAENARLQAEVERLTALVESNLNSSKVAMGKADAVLHERDSLKAEVERRKNTDPTEQHLWFNYYVRPRLLGYQFPLALMTNPTSRLLRTEREENARLKAEVERLEEALKDEQAVAGHRADVNERLRKAGDALALSVGADWAINGPDNGTEPESVIHWNAAKEGKPSV